MCKCGTKNETVEGSHETESLSPMSLLELPIITDIGQDEDVSKLIVTTHNIPSQSSVSTEPLAEENFMTVGHETEVDMAGSTNIKTDVNHSSGAESSILWGCKQCDFRFVNTNSYTSFYTTIL